ncbi:response regulator [Hymenobacter sp. B1770]|uniref:response regulator n=1 Tax=Hymenobacter sp. B1770 TaxID=1718788 RepID=UPI003CF8BE3F
MIRLFLVDDHAILRQGLRALLEPEAWLQVVGEAENGEQLLARLPATPCDVVLLDLDMPVLDGLATTRRLHAEFPDVRILILSMAAHAPAIGEVLAAGASGYVLKNAGRHEFVAAVQTVADGQRYLSSELGLAMLEKVLAGTPTPDHTAASRLSAREQEILQLVVNGLTNAEIADQLFTSKRTIETHRQNIIYKTGTKNTAALVKAAISQGWLQKD